MVNPQTVNLGIIVPLTGADVDIWGEVDVNPNMVALDGLLGGVQTIGVTNAPVTLTAPAGFTATPSPGPTQSQNRVLRFTGVLSANVRITLPLPGSYLIDNRTTGAFVLSFQGVTATEVVGIDQGAIVEIYNDGANVRFVNLGKVGASEFWNGISAIPAWVAACTVKPYLLEDGGVYNFADYPWLAAKYQGQFGGNGITTFGVPDSRGRLKLAYDGTGARITIAGCGLNGQQIGAVLDKQTNTLVVVNLPPYTPAGTNGTVTVAPPGGTPFFPVTNGSIGNQPPAGGSGQNTPTTNTVWSSAQNMTGAGPTWTGAAQGGTSTPVNNVQPSQVAGIWVTKT